MAPGGARRRLVGVVLCAVIVAGWLAVAPTRAEADHAPGLPPSDLRQVVPSRLLDTRPTGETVDGTERGTGRLVAGEVRLIRVLGRGGVPHDGAAAVLVNVTAVDPTEPAYVTVWASGAVRAPTSNLNVVPGRTAANAVVAQIGADGRIAMAVSAGSTHVVADIQAWIPKASRIGLVNPARFLDSRPGAPTVDGQGSGAGRIGPGNILGLSIRGRAGVPFDVRTALVNLTVTEPTASSYLTAWPEDEGRPLTSNLNMAAGETVANLAWVRVGSEGEILIRNAAGATHVIADVLAYSSSDADVTPLVASRLLDTRPGGRTDDGQGAGEGPVGDGVEVQVQVAGRAAVSTDLGSVMLNITAVGGPSGGWVAVWPTGAAEPPTSNAPTGRPASAGFVVVRVGVGGKVSLRVHGGSAHLIADVGSSTPNPVTAYRAAPTVLRDTPRTEPLGMGNRDGLPLTIRTVSGPTHGTLSTPQAFGCVAVHGRLCWFTVTYTPAPGFLGEDRWEFEVTDSQMNAARGSASFVVIDLAPPPDMIIASDGGGPNLATVLVVNTYHDPVDVQLGGTSFRLVQEQRTTMFRVANDAGNIGTQVRNIFDPGCGEADYDRLFPDPDGSYLVEVVHGLGICEYESLAPDLRVRAL